MLLITLVLLHFHGTHFVVLLGMVGGRVHCLGLLRGVIVALGMRWLVHVHRLPLHDYALMVVRGSVLLLLLLLLLLIVVLLRWVVHVVSL